MTAKLGYLRKKYRYFTFAISAFRYTIHLFRYVVFVFIIGSTSSQYTRARARVTRVAARRARAIGNRDTIGMYSCSLYYADVHVRTCACVVSAL